MGQTQLIGHIGKPQGIVHHTRLMGHKGTAAPANFQHIPGDQQLHGLPHGTTAYIKLLGQLELVGQFFPVGQLAVNDQLADLLRRLFCQRALFIFYRFKNGI